MRRTTRTKKSAPKRVSGTGDARPSATTPRPAVVTPAPAQSVADGGPTPSWFAWALAEPFDTVRVKLEDPTDGSLDIHCLRFGASTSKRGLIMVHGGGANGHWYRFIAPFFAHEFDVVAITNSGNGDSGHRSSEYSMDKWSMEIMQCSTKLGLLAPNRPKPFILAHSLGTYVVTNMLARVHADQVAQFGGIILADGAIRPPQLAETIHERVKEIRANDPNLKPRAGWNINPPNASPLARFKLKPYQECDNTYILKFIAESSKEVIDEDGSWCWKGDCNRDGKLDWDKMPVFCDRHVRQIAEKIPVTFMYGEDSILCDVSVADFVRKSLGRCVGVVGIPCAAHHIWLDQPLSFVSAVRGVLAAWPSEGSELAAGDDDDLIRREALLESRL